MRSSGVTVIYAPRTLLSSCALPVGMLERSKLLMVPATVTVPKFNWAMPTVTASGGTVVPSKPRRPSCRRLLAAQYRGYCR